MCKSTLGDHAIFVWCSVRTRTFVVPTVRLAVRLGHNSAGHVEQECAIGNRGVLYSPQHQCGAGQRVERSNDFSWIDMPKRQDLIVGKHVLVGVFRGRIRKMARRCGNEIADFSDRRSHRRIFRPPDDPVAKYTVIVRGQGARIHDGKVREGAVSRDEQRDPVQMSRRGRPCAVPLVLAQPNETIP